jgi:hypothetical protein
MRKAEMDEFGWILIGALIFIIIITVVWLPSRQPAPVIDPKSVELNIVGGSATTFFININGSGSGKMSNVTLTPSDLIRNWVSFDKNTFEIEGSEKVRVNVVIPKTVAPGSYLGTIEVSSPGGKTSFSLRINVIGINQAILRSKPISLDDVNIRYSVGSEDIVVRKNLEIVRSHFTETGESISISIPSQKLQLTTSGYINLTIEGANREGNLIILFNNYEVFRGLAGTGPMTIPIDLSIIGTTNTLVIKTDSPAWYKFFSKSVYRISEMKFGVKYQDILERQRIFSLEDDEIFNFKSFRLTGYICDNCYSTPLKELRVKINNQLVFSDIPPVAFFNKTFTKDIIGNPIYLRNSNNTISFSFESEAYYILQDAFLTIYYN